MSDTAEQAMPTKSNAAESSGFLDGQEYTAAFLYEFVALLVGNGVYNGELATTATSGDMSVTHGAGHAWINGVLYKNSTPFSLPINTADGSLNRYDSLMVRLDLSSNEAYAVIVQGEYAATPTAPAVTRNAETYDLKICDIYVPAGCTEITQAQITDRRLDASVCGVPVFPVQHMDMTSFYSQIVNDLANFRQRSEADFAAWVEDQEESHLATMAELVEVVRRTSDGSVAEILALLKQMNDLVDADTVGELIGAINTVDRKADKLEAEKARLFHAVFPAAGWIQKAGGGYTQTVQHETVTEYTQTGRPFIMPNLEDVEAEEAAEEALAMIAGGDTLDGAIRLVCFEDAPAVDLDLYFLGVEIDRYGG